MDADMHLIPTQENVHRAGLHLEVFEQSITGGAKQILL